MVKEISFILREKFWAKWSPALRGNASNISCLGSEKKFLDLYYVLYRKVMTFPQANSDLKNLLRPFSVFLQ
jgi:hypothetical protein